MYSRSYQDSMKIHRNIMVTIQNLQVPKLFFQTYCYRHISYKTIRKVVPDYTLRLNNCHPGDDAQ